MFGWIRCVYVAAQIVLTVSLKSLSTESDVHCFPFDDTDNMNNLIDSSTLTLETAIMSLQPYLVAENVTVGIIGGSFAHAGAPYFAGVAALKSGATLVNIITTKQAAPVIKTYNPDLIVYPILEKTLTAKISVIIRKLDVVIIGIGLEIESKSSLDLVVRMIELCRDQHKPIIVTDGGVYTLSKLTTVLKGYPSPGAIITADLSDISILKKSVLEITERNERNDTELWYRYWGENVSIMVRVDQYYSYLPNCEWNMPCRKSFRYVQGESDIISGLLSTIYSVLLKSHICDSMYKYQFIRSLAALGTARFIRLCSKKAFRKFQQSVQTEEILKEIENIFVTNGWIAT